MPSRVSESGRTSPSAVETKAPSPYGKLPAAADAPRKRNSVQMTLKIMNSTSQAPPVWDPAKRDLRPSLSGASRSRINANVMMPSSAIRAMRSWAKPSRSQCPITGIAHSSLRDSRMP